MDKKIKCNSKKNDLSMPVRVFCNDIDDQVSFYKIVLRFYCHMAEKFFVSFWPGDRGGDEAMNPESDCFKELR